MADKYCLGAVTFSEPVVLLDTVFKSGTVTLKDSILIKKKQAEILFLLCNIF